jgi:hypothetical protein
MYHMHRLPVLYVHARKTDQLQKAGTMSAIRVTAAAITPGTRILVERDSEGRLIPTRRKRGVLVATHSGKDMVRVECGTQRRYVLHTDLGASAPVPGAQTWAVAPDDAPADAVAEMPQDAAPEVVEHKTRTVLDAAQREIYRTKSNGSQGRWSSTDSATAHCTCGWKWNAATREEARSAARSHRAEPAGAPAPAEVPATCTDPAGHRPGFVGCPDTVTDCEGIPSGLTGGGRLISDERGECETGQEETARTVRDALKIRRSVSHTRVCTSDPYGRGGRRAWSTISMIVDERTVIAVLYDARPGPLAAMQTWLSVLVDGAPAVAGEYTTAARNGHGIASMVALYLDRWREAQPVQDQGAAPAARTQEAGIVHNAADGTTVEGIRYIKGKALGLGKEAGADGQAPLMWRWSRNVGTAGGWYERGSRDSRHVPHRVAGMRERLETAGYSVDVQIDDTLRPTAEVEADRAARAQARSQRLHGAASRAASDAEGRLNAVRERRDLIVPGQPIIGMADFKRRRKLAEREDSAYARQAEGERYAERAAATDAHTKRRDRSDVIARRIERLEEDQRRAERAGSTTVVADLAEQIGHWRTVLKEREAAGAWAAWEPRHFTPCDPQTWEGGDWINTGHTWYPVLKVNKKSVTTPPTIYGGSRLSAVGKPWSWTDTQALNKIKARRRDGVITRHGGAADQQDAPAEVQPQGTDAPPAPADSQMIGDVSAVKVRSLLSLASLSGLVMTGLPHMSQPEYEAVNQVISALGGEWKRSGKKHVFDRDPSTELAAFLAGGPAPVREKTSAGWVPTPGEVADQVVSMIRMDEIVQGAPVLEPSAGRGVLVDAVARVRADLDVTAVEMEPRRAAAITGATVHAGTFESWSAEHAGARFAAIVMNPPFAVDGDPKIWIAHVRRALGHLAAGGQLVAIVPASYKWREDRAHRELRELLGAMAGYEVRDLPADAYQSSGVFFRTVAVSVTAAGRKFEAGRSTHRNHARVYTGTETPIRVQALSLDRKASQSMPVQELHDSYRQSSRIARYVGECYTPGCTTLAWSFDDGNNTPLGELGEHSAYTVSPGEYSDDEGRPVWQGPDIVQCFMHGNEYETRDAAEKYAFTVWTAITYPEAAPEVSEPAPAVAPAAEVDEWAALAGLIGDTAPVPARAVPEPYGLDAAIEGMQAAGITVKTMDLSRAPDAQASARVHAEIKAETIVDASDGWSFLADLVAGN